MKSLYLSFSNFTSKQTDANSGGAGEIKDLPISIDFQG